MKSSVSNKRLILTFICFVLLTFMHAQSSNFTFSIEKRIGVSDRFFMNYENLPDAVVNNLSSLEKPKLAYELGVLVSQRISQRLYFQTGLRYVAWGHRTGKILLTDSTPESFPDCIESTTWNMFIEVPISVKYYLSFKRNSLYTRVSYAPNYNLANTEINKSYFGDEIVKHTSEAGTNGLSYNRLNMMGEFGLGWSMPLSEHLDVEIGPVFRIQTFDQVQLAALNRRLFFYGLSTAITFR